MMHFHKTVDLKRLNLNLIMFFGSDDIQTIIACVHIPGSNLSSSVEPTVQDIKQ
jgi:hypothetical protein